MRVIYEIITTQYVTAEVPDQETAETKRKNLETEMRSQISKGEQVSVGIPHVILW